MNLYKHIAVVHGIGRQKLNETAINFMNEICRARVELVAMFIWSIGLALVSLDIQSDAVSEVKNLLGWATGLVVTVLVWKIHTGLEKGLVELWRYGHGSTKFKPKPTVPEPLLAPLGKAPKVRAIPCVAQHIAKISA